MMNKVSRFLRTPVSEILGRLFGICRRSTVVELREALNHRGREVDRLYELMDKLQEDYQKSIFSIETKVETKYVMPAETFSKLKQKISPAIVSTASTDLQAAFIVGQRSVLDEVEKLWVN